MAKHIVSGLRDVAVNTEVRMLDKLSEVPEAADVVVGNTEVPVVAEELAIEGTEVVADEADEMATEGTEVVEDETEEVDEAPAFDLADFRYDGPWPEKMPEEADCTVYNGGKGVKALDLLKGNTQPVFVFKREIWEEVQYLIHKTPNKEMAMFLITKQFAPLVPKYIAVDLYFPEQEVGSGGVSIDSESVDGFYKSLNAHPDYKEHMHSRLAHLHSHHGMGVFWSAADTNQQLNREDLGFYDTFRYYLVVNTKNQVRCSFVMYEPFLRRFDNIPVVVVGKPVELTDERKAELDAYIEERTKPLTTNVFADIKYFGDDLTETYTPPAYRPVAPAAYKPGTTTGGFKPYYGGTQQYGTWGRTTYTGWGKYDWDDSYDEPSWKKNRNTTELTGLTDFVFGHKEAKEAREAREEREDTFWEDYGETADDYGLDYDIEANMDTAVDFLTDYANQYMESRLGELDDYVEALEVALYASSYSIDKTTVHVSETLYPVLFGNVDNMTLARKVTKGALVLAGKGMFDKTLANFGKSVVDFIVWVELNSKEMCKYGRFISYSAGVF